MRTLLILVFLGASAFPIAALAQEEDSIRQKVQETVKTKVHGVKLLRKHQKDPKEVVYVWGPEEQPAVARAGGGLMVLVFNAGSKREAAERMRIAIDRLSMGPGEKRTDIGDEAYFSKNELSRSAALRFRKANVYIELSGPATVIEELAMSFTELIPEKN
jgi:hypothetical protein